MCKAYAPVCEAYPVVVEAVAGKAYAPVCEAYVVGEAYAVVESEAYAPVCEAYPAVVGAVAGKAYPVGEAIPLI